jgi:F-type H+-transporting ATPase subunit delta
MSISVVGKRYATALLELSSAANSIERVSRDLRDFAHSWQGSRELRAVFENPSVSQQSRRAVLRDMALQSSMSAEVRDLLMLLADRERLRHVAEVADAYEAMAEARSGKVRAEITTATALPAAYFTELERSLAAITGRQIVLTQKIDPSLIAGVVTRIGDPMFDGSIKSRLSELKEELLK